MFTCIGWKGCVGLNERAAFRQYVDKFQVHFVGNSTIEGLKMVRTVVDEKAVGNAAADSATGPFANVKVTSPKLGKRAASKVVATDLPVAMTGRASAAKAKEGDEPVFAYISSLPQPQRGIAEHVDALAAKTLPGLKRSVKWGMAWYGVGDGWCFSCGGFAGHVKLTFGRGSSLKPVPPVTPIGMGKDSRGVDLESVEDLDEPRTAAWMKQAVAMPGFGGKKR